MQSKGFFDYPCTINYTLFLKCLIDQSGSKLIVCFQEKSHLEEMAKEGDTDFRKNKDSMKQLGELVEELQGECACEKAGFRVIHKENDANTSHFMAPHN